MKGPFAFFVSLAAVIVVGLVVVLPAFKEKQRLLADHGDTTGAAVGPDVDEDRFSDALKDLREELRAGTEARAGYPDDSLAGALGATVEKRQSDGVILLMEWNHLPRLLTALAEPTPPTLEKLSAVPAENANQCRVTIRFSALPGTPGGR